ncbi:hypothetical protein KI387_025218, partial [Taxus chinensis]
IQNIKQNTFVRRKEVTLRLRKMNTGLRDKYDPSNLEAAMQRRNKKAKVIAKGLLEDLQNGTLDLSPLSAEGLPSSGNIGGIDNTSEDDTNAGLNRRKNGRSNARKSEVHSAAPRAPFICSEPERVLKDIEQGCSLIRKLDAENGIEENLLSENKVKGIEGVELLDVVITYLWRVLAIDYYGMTKSMEHSKGFRHIRVGSLNNNKEKSAEEVIWEEKLDSTWQARLHGMDPLEPMLVRERLEAVIEEASYHYIRKICDKKYEWKYGCGIPGCAKLFRAPEFLRKHLRGKHQEKFEDVISKARDEIYFSELHE